MDVPLARNFCGVSSWKPACLLRVGHERSDRIGKVLQPDLLARTGSVHFVAEGEQQHGRHFDRNERERGGAPGGRAAPERVAQPCRDGQAGRVEGNQDVPALEHHRRERGRPAQGRQAP